MDQQPCHLRRSMMGTAIAQMAVMNQASSCVGLHICDGHAEPLAITDRPMLGCRYICLPDWALFLPQQGPPGPPVECFSCGRWYLR